MINWIRKLFGRPRKWTYIHQVPTDVWVTNWLGEILRWHPEHKLWLTKSWSDINNEMVIESDYPVGPFTEYLPDEDELDEIWVLDFPCGYVASDREYINSKDRDQGWLFGWSDDIVDWD